jgi:hypothetical protein
MGPEIDHLFWWGSAFDEGNGEDRLESRILAVLLKLFKKTERPMFGGFSR